MLYRVFKAFKIRFELVQEPQKLPQKTLKHAQTCDKLLRFSNSLMPF